MKQTIYLLALVAIFLTSCGDTGNEPVSAFKMTVPTEFAPVAVTFENVSEGAEAYMWDFGDGQTSTDANPEHKYEYWGTFTVSLTAINGGKSVTSQQNLTIKEPIRSLVEIVTDLGSIRIELSNLTPMHKENFIKLAREKFYVGTLFHRVINGFMIQGGDPDSRNAPAAKSLGQGGPGYTVPAEFRKGLYHYKGALCAARQGDQVNPTKASSGSQFYIVHGAPIQEALLGQVQQRRQFQYTADEIAYYRKAGGTPQLDMDYTVFGYVKEGFEIIDKIATQPVSGTNPDRPIKDIKILAVNVIE